MIAQVIVDIAAKQTDRIFEYHIPESISDVEIGSRVFVPFGPRKLQGFVVGISKTSNYPGKLKDLLVVVDEMPPLTPELVRLSKYMAKNVYSYRISILKTMLPRVMRANYRKILTPISKSAQKLALFKGDPVDLNDLTDNKKIALARKLLRNNEAKVEYLVENRAKKKTENQYLLTESREEYQKILNSVRRNALKQRRILTDIIENYDSYPRMQDELEKTAKITTTDLTQAVKKNWLKKAAVEVYRNPLAGFDNKKKAVTVTLNEEQEAAVDQINDSVQKQVSKTYLLEGITGSGKTEVYLHAISKTLDHGRNALMLVPEISLTPQMVHRPKLEKLL